MGQPAAAHGQHDPIVLGRSGRPEPPHTTPATRWRPTYRRTSQVFTASFSIGSPTGRPSCGFGGTYRGIYVWCLYSSHQSLGSAGPPPRGFDPATGPRETSSSLGPETRRSSCPQEYPSRKASRRATEEFEHHPARGTIVAEVRQPIRPPRSLADPKE